jgi:hypothetical protein
MSHPPLNRSILYRYIDDLGNPCYVEKLSRNNDIYICYRLDCGNDDEGDLHRLDGPAQITPSKKSWYQFGLKHRVDGPAMEYLDGWNMWYYEGKIIDVSSQEDFERYLKMKSFW